MKTFMKPFNTWLILLIIGSNNILAQSVTLTHSYTFEDGTAKDIAGNADGTVYGGTFSDGLYTTSNQGEYISLPASYIAINEYTAITIEALITAGDGTNPGNTMMYYLGNTNASGYGTYGYFTSLARADNKSRAAISCSDSSPWSYESGADGTELDDGESHYIVSTLTNDVITLYIDGQLAQSTTLSTTNKIEYLSNAYAYLCKSGYNTDPTWLGSIDEFNIYNGAFTADIVTNNYTSADLTGITLGAGELSPAFDPAITEYSVTLPEGTSFVTVEGAKEVNAASLIGEGIINTSSGTGMANLEVTAIDGSTVKTYTINFTVDGNYGMYLPGGTDGSSSNIDISGLSLTTLPFTVEMWIKPEGDQNAYAGLFYHRGSGDAGLQYAAGWQGTNLLRLNFGGNSLLTDPVKPDQWHHVACVITSTSNTIYLDGKEYTQTGLSQSAYDFSADNLFLGWDMAVADRTFNGTINEVRVWKQARTAEEILSNKYEVLVGTETDLVAYYSFDDQAASSITDLTANAHAGTINGGVYVPAYTTTDTDADGIPDFIDNCPFNVNYDQADMDGDGIGDVCDDDRDGDGIADSIDNCPEVANADQEDLDEDGIGDVCDPELPSDLNFAMKLPGGSDGSLSNIDISGLNLSTLPYTIEMWIKPDGSQIDNTGVIYHRGTGNAGIQYSSSWQGSGKLRFMTNISGDYGTVTDEVTTDTWHHVAVVLTSTTRTVYMDGKSYSQTINNSAYDFSTGALYLGWDSGASNRAFKGIIEEVRIWNTARSAQEVEDNQFTLYNGDEEGLVAYYNFDDRNLSLVTDATSNANHGVINGGIYVLSNIYTSMQYGQSTTSQPSGFVNTGESVIMCVEIETNHMQDAISVTQFDLSAIGTTNYSDIENVKIYAAGTDSLFTTNTLIGETGSSLSAADFTVDCDYSLEYGKNYFFVVYDVANNATNGNQLDLVCNNITVDGIVETPYVTAPEGVLEINSDIFIHNQKFSYDIVSYDAYTSSNGTNFVSFQQNALMTYKGYQYITYWNQSAHVCMARKKLPSGSWEEIEFTDFTSSHDLSDNHYNISFGICANDGTIHISYDHHNDALHYRKSTVDLTNDPDNANWSTASFGANQGYLITGSYITASSPYYGGVTYPRFISKPDGNLLFEYRSGNSGDGNSHLYEYNGEWTYIGEYMHGRTGTSTDYSSKCGYINGLHYTPGGTRLHVSLVWRETPTASTNHEVYYAYSDDDGRTWYDCDDNLIATTGVTPLHYDMEGFKILSVGQNRGLINQEGQAVDSDGNIHILQSYMLDSEGDDSNWYNSRVKAYLRHIYRDENGEWQSDVIAPSIIDRSDIAVDKFDNLYVVAPGYRVFFASKADNWQTWTEFDLSESNSATAEGIIDKDLLLQDNVLSFCFAHSDMDGKIIVPYYLLENTDGNGNGVNISVFDDTQFVNLNEQSLDNINITNEDILTSSDEFSILYDGKLETKYVEEYTLHLTTTGSVKVWINDELAIETGSLVSPTEFQTTLQLVPSHIYSLRIEGLYTKGNTETKLEWSSDSQTREIVPLTSFYGELKDYSTNIDMTKETIKVETIPNPFHSSFTVKADGFNEYQLFNSAGALMESGEFENQKEVGSKLASGIYYLKVISDKNENTVKVIKQ
ncbi:LamG-like jellyroll fold domain-containing protein [Carboxylicivirga caseinilyticus]|uniref:LamG-like jellyroll fold domain-containing protein n=1 Tax=Carboxylicivirga caseinilyticus TaxID=3417572 RepID=UPI003D33C570|nr:BNR-4 repeat-containing protein [Marinilabiliaceae bacterium A049]